jgi:hypothetical protein
MVNFSNKLYGDAVGIFSWDFTYLLGSHESCKVPTKNSGYMPPTTLCLVLFQLRVQGGTSLLGYFDGRKQGN